MSDIVSRCYLLATKPKTPKTKFPTKKEMFTNLLTDEILKLTKKFNKRLRKLNKPPKPDEPKTPEQIRDQEVLKAISSLCSDYQDAIYRIYAVIINEDQDKYCEQMIKLRRANEKKTNEDDIRVSLDAFTLIKTTNGQGDYHTFPQNEIILITRGDYGYYWDSDIKQVERGNYVSRMNREWKVLRTLSTKEVSEFILSPNFDEFANRMFQDDNIKRILIDRLEVE